MSELLISYDGLASNGQRDGLWWGYQPTFDVRAGHDRVTVAARMTTEMRDECLGHLNRDRPAAGADDVERAFAAWLLNRIRAAPPDGAEGSILIEAEHSDLVSVVACADRSCDYQVGSGRDLFCVCASDSDPTVVGLVEGRRAATTSRAVCNACNLPNTDRLCTHFLHPAVIGTRGAMHARMVSSAMCDLGNDRLLLGNVAGCIPSGHECWQLIVKLDEGHNAADVNVLALPEALDYLDVVWRLAFGRYLLGRSTTAHLAGLVGHCSSRDGFAQRMNDLADVLDSFNAQVPEGQAKVDGSLNRATEWLRVKLEPWPNERARALTAIDILRKVAIVRSAMTHSDAGRKLPGALNELGLLYPPDWGLTWDQIRELTSIALSQLREAVTAATPEAE